MFDDLYFVDLVFMYLVLCQPRFINYIVMLFLVALILILSVLAKRRVPLV